LFREKTVYYRLIASILGDVGVVWLFESGEPLIVCVQLPRKDLPTAEILKESYPGITEEMHKDLEEICAYLGAFLEGRNVDFPMKYVKTDQCRAFQMRVLLETTRIPRGSVTAYGDLAKRISAPGAARAVGSALAKNPLPLIIPCHRVVKSDGYVGQFGGGTELKKALLRLEGVRIDERGRMTPSSFYR
jgi:methylated-DNA-[protein]-cysteine S-methyltransferase